MKRFLTLIYRTSFQLLSIDYSRAFSFKLFSYLFKLRSLSIQSLFYVHLLWFRVHYGIFISPKRQTWSGQQFDKTIHFYGYYSMAWISGVQCRFYRRNASGNEGNYVWWKRVWREFQRLEFSRTLILTHLLLISDCISQTLLWGDGSFLFKFWFFFTFL